MKKGDELLLCGDELEFIKSRFITSNSFVTTIQTLSENRLKHDMDTWDIITEKHPELKGHRLTFHHSTNKIIVTGHEE